MKKIQLLFISYCHILRLRGKNTIIIYILLSYLKVKRVISCCAPNLQSSFSAAKLRDAFWTGLACLNFEFLR